MLYLNFDTFIQVDETGTITMLVGEELIKIHLDSDEYIALVQTVTNSLTSFYKIK